ncbi:hypothetical protein SD71_11540 [Cohnella kolymensis]|uniref:Chromate transporter n=2 Tax=Cohnella kolymensis TaxID=1590652 RepID=A0ABR5A4X8_9BACL|nr:hypothetical protein SD71_11540 [Cohnella kolymensis]
MWGSTQQLEQVLVHQKCWVTEQELEAMLVTATIVPAPRFIAFAALIGYKLKQWPGSLAASLSLIAPGAIMLMAAVFLVNPSLLHGKLDPLQHTVSIAIAGILFGNATTHFRKAKRNNSRTAAAAVLTIAVAASIIAGVPLLAAAAVGFIAGYFVLRNGKKEAEHESG